MESDELKQYVKCGDVLSEHGVQWQGRNISCPFPDHQDNQPSFSVIDGGNAFRCHGCGRKGDVITLYMELNGLEFADAMERMTERYTNAPASNRPMQVDRIYDYVDENGVPLFEVVRFHSPKTFRQRVPGGQQWGIKGVRRVLYNLPSVIGAERVYVVEGEKDADRLIANGLVATTCAMGAGKWLPQYTDTLRGKDVVILPDNDEQGQAHADMIHEQLPGSVVIKLPVGPKQDVSDYLAKWTIKELVELADTALNPETQLSDSGTAVLDRLDVYLHKRQTGEIRPIPTGIENIDRHLSIEQQNLITIAARPGGGKTALMCSVAAMQLLKGVARPGIFTFELSENDIAMRILSSMTGIPFARIRANEIAQHERELLEKARRAMSTMRIDEKRKDVAGMTERIRLWQKHFGVDMVFIDQLSKVQLEKGKSRFEQYSSTVNAIKLMGRELNIPIALLCQQRRPGDGKQHAPTMNELKDTGSLEEDSDVVLCLWRPEQEDNLTEIKFNGQTVQTANKVFMYCRKYRNGELFKVNDFFDGASMTVGRVRV